MSGAPYRPGDRVHALLMAREGGTCLATVTIDHVTALSKGRSWRVAGSRPRPPHREPGRDCPRVEWVVDEAGRDIHGHLKPVTAGGPDDGGVR